MVSSILGIEVIDNKREIGKRNFMDGNTIQNSFTKSSNSILLVNKKILEKNADFLEEIYKQISMTYKELEIE
jgi:hypothetical protein